MGERELLRKLAAQCRWKAERVPVDSADEQTLQLMAGVFTAVSNALATQPDPVPELPPYVKHCEGDWYRVEFANGDSDLMDASCDPDDLLRIADAARILAARERARRAGR